MVSSGRRAAALMALVVGLLAACGANGPTAPSPSSIPVAATPSTDSPGGALAGFLAAARDEDESQVGLWLATPAEANDLDELVHVYSGFGSSGGVFWIVQGVAVTGVSATGGGRARVTLSGEIAWCLGKAPNDPAAACSVVNPVAGTAHTYMAVQVDGKWKADIDINASSGLDHNPQASPTAGAPTSSPTST